MTLATPIAASDLADILKIETVTWTLVHQQQHSSMGSGEVLSSDLGPALYEAEVATIPLPHVATEKARSRLLALDGSIQSFMLYNPAADFPETDPQGTALEGHSLTILSVGTNRKEFAIAGLPAGFHVPWGAYCQIEAGTPSRVALVQFVEGKSASPSGNTSAIECRPHLRPWISAGAVVQLVKPAAKVKLVPRSLRVEQVGALHSRLRFTARQTLAAG